MQQTKTKRFYKHATASKTRDGWLVELDGRPVKTPAKAPFLLPTAALAQAVAEEWQAQGERIDAGRMPLTSLSFTAIDLVAGQRSQITEELAEFAQTDLLCYRAEHPESLVCRQRDSWQPLLDWAALTFDAPLAVTSGIYAIEQDGASLRALRRTIERHDDFALAALAAVVRLSGSLVIGLAVSHAHIDAAAAFDAAELDQTYELEHWGEDAEAKALRDALQQELADCERFLALLRQ
ncbi:ATP12 family chaperone protein [Aquibaculum arenosum]|uniref:ATPase n=1 Tax=Aquibaculum arenosum TaxID=3032591 RepID=A0ABT5YP80_9PROT|nr:ATP12 family protein [Fodinicurvata sp. CAU 1616]MDF2096770.1 ATPase [Fodinicurvata sp. CAU 1616]